MYNLRKRTKFVLDWRLLVYSNECEIDYSGIAVNGLFLKLRGEDLNYKYSET